MYYANQNGNYMQDLNFYNQINPNIQNPNNFNQFGVPMQFNNNSLPYNQMPNQVFPNNNSGLSMNQIMQMNNNLENMYPCTYRIINPVVERVVDGTFSRNQIVNEDNLNNMVDTVFNIVESQLEREEQVNQNSSENRNTNNNSNTNNISNQTRNSIERNDINTQRDRNNSLIRDIIRILLIRSLLSRNNNRINNFSNMPNNNFGVMRTNFL